MKRKDFYLFRHGETEYNRLGLRQGQGIDAGLNETGRLQAQKLAVYLEEREIEVIYTSPLRRARQTAEIAAVRLCIAVISDERLLEGNFGAAEGLSKEEVKRRWPEIIDNWYKPGLAMAQGFPGGESKAAIQRRMQQALADLLEKPESVIGISSHSAALRFLLMTMGGNGEKLPNAEAIHVVWDGNWRIEE